MPGTVGVVPVPFVQITSLIFLSSSQFLSFFFCVFISSSPAYFKYDVLVLF